MLMVVWAHASLESPSKQQEQRRSHESLLVRALTLAGEDEARMPLVA